MILLVTLDVLINLLIPSHLFSAGERTYDTNQWQIWYPWRPEEQCVYRCDVWSWHVFQVHLLCHQVWTLVFVQREENHGEMGRTRGERGDSQGVGMMMVGVGPEFEILYRC